MAFEREDFFESWQLWYWNLEGTKRHFRHKCNLRKSLQEVWIWGLLDYSPILPTIYLTVLTWCARVDDVNLCKK